MKTFKLPHQQARCSSALNACSLFPKFRNEEMSGQHSNPFPLLRHMLRLSFNIRAARTVEYLKHKGTEDIRRNKQRFYVLETF
jgi:hypothetical protein